VFQVFQAIWGSAARLFIARSPASPARLGTVRPAEPESAAASIALHMAGRSAPEQPERRGCSRVFQGVPGVPELVLGTWRGMAKGEQRKRTLRPFRVDSGTRWARWREGASARWVGRGLPLHIVSSAEDMAAELTMCRGKPCAVRLIYDFSGLL